MLRIRRLPRSRRDQPRAYCMSLHSNLVCSQMHRQQLRQSRIVNGPVSAALGLHMQLLSAHGPGALAIRMFMLCCDSHAHVYLNC
jgi:hypothetical protein